MKLYDGYIMNNYKIILERLVLLMFVNCIVETIVAFIIGIRNKWDIAMVGMINLITNPIMNAIIIPIRSEYYHDKTVKYGVLIFSELIVIILEGIFYKKFWRETKKIHLLYRLY